MQGVPRIGLDLVTCSHNSNPIYTHYIQLLYVTWGVLLCPPFVNHETFYAKLPCYFAVSQQDMILGDSLNMLLFICFCNKAVYLLSNFHVQKILINLNPRSLPMFLYFFIRGLFLDDKYRL